MESALTEPVKAKLIISSFNILLAVSDICRSIQFNPHIIDKVLENHLIRAMHVPEKDICEIGCYQEPNCVSYNFGPEHSDTPTCELNNRNRQQVSSSDFVSRNGYVYRQILVCNTTYLTCF